MALKLKYTDEHGIVHINMSPKTSPRDDTEIENPKFDTINHRFGQYDLFGEQYEPDTSGDSSGDHFKTSGDQPSLFRSRYNSIEEELANTPYAFATERSLRSAGKLDITIDRTDVSPSKDIEDNRFFNRKLSLEYDDLFRGSVDAPAFTVTQLIHAQDRYFDLSSRHSVDLSLRSADLTRQSVRTSSEVDAFQVLKCDGEVKTDTASCSTTCP
ncbi:putative Y97E10AL.1 [Operophtera brumata]|uniref:Putative Y97E10AL.1 n=1 Tax=Operophtera brumata TaxID=104452 RepID=A0A0L7LTE0_OPEBR|nr:putative Y97E10AL.1 [Operophtera brumata]